MLLAAHLRAMRNDDVLRSRLREDIAVCLSVAMEKILINPFLFNIDQSLPDMFAREVAQTCFVRGRILGKRAISRAPELSSKSLQ